MRIRPPDPDELARVAALIRACDLVDLGEEDTTTEELADEWLLPGLDLARDTWVADEDGEVVGYARVWNREGARAFLDAYVHPSFRGRGLGSRLLALMEERAREQRLPLLVNFAAPRDAAAQTLLQRNGYTLVRHHIRMAVELHASPRPFELPDGIALGRFVPAEDDHAVHAAMNDAFAEEPGHVADSLDAWRARLLGSAAFDPALWLVAREGADVAGAALGFLEGREGWVQGLGVRPAWRRRGLGLALLLASFAAFWDRGCRRVSLSVDSDNPTAARRLYERAGMRETFRIERYEKRLS